MEQFVRDATAQKWGSEPMPEAEYQYSLKCIEQVNNYIEGIFKILPKLNPFYGKKDRELFINRRTICTTVELFTRTQAAVVSRDSINMKRVAEYLRDNDIGTIARPRRGPGDEPFPVTADTLRCLYSWTEILTRKLSLLRWVTFYGSHTELEIPEVRISDFDVRTFFVHLNELPALYAIALSYPKMNKLYVYSDEEENTFSETMEVRNPMYRWRVQFISRALGCPLYAPPILLSYFKVCPPEHEQTRYDMMGDEDYTRKVDPFFQIQVKNIENGKPVDENERYIRRLAHQFDKYYSEHPPVKINTYQKDTYQKDPSKCCVM